MKKYVVIVALLIISCKQREREEIIPVNMTDTIVAEKDNPEISNGQFGDTIRLSFKQPNGNYVAEGEIDSLHSRIYVKFTNENTGKLKASLKTSSEANIRFNQIIYPDKTMDGPFGRDIEQELTQTGEHSLIIGHSLMAENPYYGKFTVDVKIAE